jgi:ATP-binding cassette subfamily F protein 3
MALNHIWWRLDGVFISFCNLGKPIEEYRRQLGSFGVSGDLALQTVASLSGGQKSRVAFSRMCMGQPNFLVLDEPTNHLDIETIEALGNAITKYTVSDA